MTRRFTAPNDSRAGRLVRPARLSLSTLVMAAVAALLPVPSAAAGAAYGLAEPSAGQAIADFYAARGGRPLWLDGESAPATVLIDLLSSAEADGLDSDRYRPKALARAVRALRDRSPAEIRRVDLMLSQAFVAYVRDLKRTPPVGIVWVDPELKPKPPTARQLLETAANASSLETWLADMRFMHPIYAGLRDAIARGQGGAAERQVLRLNLERARALPSGNQRYIIVNATAARLTAYEGGEIVDSMRVVVGKPRNPTPLMAAYIRFTALNPYWYVPPDLAAERIAPNVLKHGLSYLRAQGYQVMADWNDDDTIIDPATIDWRAVADGTREVHIRQLPGPANSMGTMKFMFPNAEGVYLHDTPDKTLLSEPARMFSGGCVRLEDAPRLAAWLHGKPLTAAGRMAEQRVDLPRPVPVFITYLTVMPSGTELAVFPDVYGRDRDELALLDRSRMAGR
jgi:murein L,D-transpeptidase YcbB/YkuD